jgi:hypothetical protein
MTEEEHREIMAAIADLQVTIDQVDLRTQAIQQALKDVGIPSRANREPRPPSWVNGEER